MPDKPKDFWAYLIGPLTASVCSSLAPEQTVVQMNQMHPAGTTHGWKIASDETFHGGQPNPCPCPNNPKTHKHYLLDC